MHLLYQKNVEEQWFLTTASGATSKCSQGIHEVIPGNIIFVIIFMYANLVILDYYEFSKVTQE